MRLSGFYGPWLLFMALLFWASSRPATDVPTFLPDYVLHASAYFLLGVLTVRAFAKGILEPRSVHRPVLLLAGAFGFSLLYGVSDEWHQSFVPGRDAGLRDVVADGVGALVAASTIGVFWRWKQRTGARSD